MSGRKEHHKQSPQEIQQLTVAHTLGVVRRRSLRSTAHGHSLRSQKSERLLPHDGNKNSYGSLGDDNDDIPSDEVTSLCNWKQDLLAVKSLILGSYLNIFLLLFPLCFISYYMKWDDSYIFFINFCTMIPLASILGDATECLAEHLGDTVGGLLNATFGNAVEVVVTILALLKSKEFADSYKKTGNKSDCEGRENLLFVVQTSLIGSIFSNSLLVLGCVLLANGVKFSESKFNTTAVSSSVSLLMIAGFVMILPAPYGELNAKSDELMISHAAAIILMAMYICSLVFVLYTHKHILDTASIDQFSGTISQPHKESFHMKPFTQTKAEKTNTNLHNTQSPAGSHGDVHINVTDDHNDILLGGSDTTTIKQRGCGSSELSGNSDKYENDDINEKGDNKNSISDSDEDDELEMTLIGSTLLLFISTTLVAVLSEYLVDAIEPMTQTLNMSEAFVGIILIPIIGNAVEHITAVRMAWRNKMDIALSIAVGSAAQVALFVVPLAVIIAWFMGLELSLDFESFEVYMFIFSTVIIYAIVNDGTSNWLEGVMLLGLYVLIGIAVWDQELETDC